MFKSVASSEGVKDQDGSAKSAPTTMTDVRSEIVLNSEKVRLYGYAGFWCVVLIGIILTEATKGTFEGSAPADLSTGILNQVFGYANICIYFDYAPSNYVLPFVWAPVMMTLLVYLYTQWVEVEFCRDIGALSRKQYVTITSMMAFSAFTIVLFSTIFAVTPTGDNITLRIHTAPFSILQVGMVFLAVANALYGWWSGYYKELELPRLWFIGVKIYVVMFAVTSLIKVPVAWIAIARPSWWNPGPGLIGFIHFIDVWWLLQAAVIPMLKAAYLLKFKSAKMRSVTFLSSIAYGREAGGVLPWRRHLGNRPSGVSTGTASEFAKLNPKSTTTSA